jgi:hypothetical protein
MRPRSPQGRGGLPSGAVTSSGLLNLEPPMLSNLSADSAPTSDRYGHLFPRGDDKAELAAAERAFLG